MTFQYSDFPLEPFSWLHILILIFIILIGHAYKNRNKK